MTAAGASTSPQPNGYGQALHGGHTQHGGPLSMKANRLLLGASMHSTGGAHGEAQAYGGLQTVPNGPGGAAAATIGWIVHMGPSSSPL